jgi:regulator of sigma E protease
MSLLTAILAFAVAIGILVVVHEFGHYSVARLCGVKVLRFSIGFGTPLVRWVSKKDGTEWTIAALPLGGYVKMLDERETDQPIEPAELPRAFNRQSLGKRFAIVAAGPIANFLLAIVLFAGIYACGVKEPAAEIGPPAAATLAAQAGLQGGETILGLRSADDDDTIDPVRSWDDLRWKLLSAAFEHRRVVLIARQAGSTFDFPLDLAALPGKAIDDDFMGHLGLAPGGTARIVSVAPDSPAAQAGLQPGDLVRGLDGRPVRGVQAFVDRVQAAAGHSLSLDIERAGKPLTLALVPAPQVDEPSGKTVGHIGAALGAQLDPVQVQYGPLESLQRGARKTWDISVFSVRMFARMVSGQASLKNLSGPVTIADYAGKSARMGLAAFVSFLALVSISLGVLNLLPIPVLDGGHLLYYSVEAVTGKAVSDRWQSILQRGGLVCIFALSAIALFNDLARLIHF